MSEEKDQGLKSLLKEQDDKSQYGHIYESNFFFKCGYIGKQEEAISNIKDNDKSKNLQY